VTHLRKMMLEDLQRRNYAENTIRSYIRIVKDFSRRFQRSPERLGPKHIREYQSELFTKRKYAASTVTLYLAALPSRPANSASTETCDSSRSRKPLPHGAGHCLERTGWFTRNHPSVAPSMCSAI